MDNQKNKEWKEDKDDDHMLRNKDDDVIEIDMDEETETKDQREKREQREFEEELLRKSKENRISLNRSAGPAKHSTLLEDKEEEKEIEDPEPEQEGNILMNLIFGNDDRQSYKKRKAGSPETMGRSKRDKREEQEEPEETEEERDLGMLREVLEILTTKGPVGGEKKYRAVNILAELYKLNKANKSSLYLGSQASAVDSDASTQEQEQENKGATKPKMVEMATQTDAWHGPPGAVKVASLEGIRTYEEFQGHVRLDWPERIYKKAVIEIGNPVEMKANVKVVVTEPNDPGMNFSVQRLYRDRYPALATLKGDYEDMELTYTVKENGVRVSTTETIIKTKSHTPEQLWDALVKVREEAKDEDLVALHHTSYMPVEDLRKMAEAIFQKTAVKKVVIHTTATRRERPTYGFIVKKKDATYSQLLEGVEKAVGGTEAKGAIQSLRSTRDGGLLITMDKDQAAAAEIKNAITQRESGLTAQMVGSEGQEVIHVRGMTSNTTEEQIKEAVRREV
ncbi:uncharacterized protein LOC126891378 [Diabrotica virgifera virgifera]|uniref:Uncharacterized protein n=1 Tax=Diabrotica virgifera virgifera TaxID=50390 RepID=A0ABM5L249_DIAVI|nr:uncharacterized protein LOC126891378 [Diabrotica virgifera virgifera]